MFRIFGQLRDIAGKLQELRVRSIETETSAKVAFRNANEALSRAVKCEDAAVERGNELASRWQSSESQWWKRWEDVVHALQKHSQDMAELDKRITTLEGRQYMAEADAKSLIEIVDEPKARRKTRGRMGPHRRLAVLESKIKSGELPRDLFDSAKLTIPLSIIALYECTGGYNLHKRGLIMQDKPTTGLKPFGVSVDDHTTRGTNKDRRPYQRTSYYGTWNQREQAKAQLNAYHELCRAYYAEKGRKP
jgi:hypothetical protein